MQRVGEVDSVFPTPLLEAQGAEEEFLGVVESYPGACSEEVLVEESWVVESVI